MFRNIKILSSTYGLPVLAVKFEPVIAAMNIHLLPIDFLIFA